MLDAPVSGGEPKAIDGTLAIMVGGNEMIFESVKEVLQVVGQDVTRVGIMVQVQQPSWRIRLS